MPPWQFIGHRVAMVPQSRSLFGELSVHDNLMLACWTFRGDKARVARALDHAYDRFPILKDRRGQMAGAMSGGQQRFLELARALVLEPQVLLLDEPTAMVAPKLSAEIYEFIAGLPAQGISVLLVDQNVRQCVRISDHLYVLELGRNKVDGSARQFGRGPGAARSDRAVGGLPDRFPGGEQCHTWHMDKRQLLKSALAGGVDRQPAGWCGTGNARRPTRRSASA